MDIILALITGLIFGCFLAYFFIRTRIVGRLRIDRSCPEDPPCLFLELSKKVDIFTNRKYVVFKIKNENFLPQK